MCSSDLERPSRRPGGMGGEVRPEVPWPGGTRWGHGHSSPRREEGCCRGWEGEAESVLSSVLGSRRRRGCYSAALASAPSALPSTSSSEQSPVPFRAIRRGTTNGRSPRLGAEAAVSRVGQAAAVLLMCFKATFRGKLASDIPRGEATGVGGPPGTQPPAGTGGLSPPAPPGLKLPKH